MTVIITWGPNGKGELTDIHGKPLPNLPPDLLVLGTMEVHPAFKLLGYRGQLVVEVEPADVV